MALGLYAERHLKRCCPFLIAVELEKYRGIQNGYNLFLANLFGVFLSSFVSSIVEGYLVQLKKYLNKPCPKCGGNLLAEADYCGLTVFLKAACHPVTRFINWVLIRLGLQKKNFRISHDGTGTITITEIKGKNSI